MLIWLLVLTIDIFFNFLSPILYFFTLFLLIRNSSKIEISFLLIFFPGKMFMYIFDQFIVGYSALLLLLSTGLFLIYKDLKDLRSEITRAIIPLLVILTGFLITYYYAPKGYYSGYKIIAVITNGIAYFLFFVALIRTDKFNNIRFSMFLLFLFVFFVKMEYIKGVLFTPHGILDFGFIRRNANDNLDLGISFSGYHEFGALALYAVIFLFSWTKRLKPFHVIMMILGIYFGFLSGARQMIFGLILILCIYLFRYYRRNLVLFVPTIMLIFGLGTITIGEIDVPFLSDILLNRLSYEDALGRGNLYSDAIEIFKDNPLMGAGIGGFSFGGELRSYPHNILLEVLAEGGLFMLCVIIVSIYFAKTRSNFSWWDQTENGTVFLFLVFGFTIRAFSSSDLIENIALLSALVSTGIFTSIQEYDEIDTSG